jgi:hypothetical protein
VWDWVCRRRAEDLYSEDADDVARGFQVSQLHSRPKRSPDMTGHAVSRTALRIRIRSDKLVR